MSPSVLRTGGAFYALPREIIKNGEKELERNGTDENL